MGCRCLTRDVLALVTLWVAEPAVAIEAPQGDRFVLDSLLLHQADLGSKRAGALCLPAATLQWRDVAAGDEALTDFLVEQIAKEVFAGAMPAGFGGQLLAIKAKSCAKRFGLGDSSTLSGEGVVTIRWSIGGNEETAIITESRFAFKSAKSGSGAILGAALRAAAKDLNVQLVAGSRPGWQ